MPLDSTSSPGSGAANRESKRDSPRLLSLTLEQESAQGHRPNNQDAACALSFAEGRGALLAVADGMGGYCGGETASRIAIECIQGLIPKAERAREKAADAALFRSLLPRVYQDIAAEISLFAANRNDYREMGTTLGCVGFLDGKYVVTNVGDSRVYHLQRGQIRQLTRDHTALAEAMARGTVPQNASETANLNKALTRVLSTGHCPNVDVFPEELQTGETQPGDILLLTTDGLHSAVSMGEIAQAFQEERNLQSALLNLIRLALSKGSKDNITIAALRVEERAVIEQRRGAKRSGQSRVSPAADLPAGSVPAATPGHAGRKGGGRLQPILRPALALGTLAACLAAVYIPFRLHKTARPAAPVPFHRQSEGTLNKAPVRSTVQSARSFPRIVVKDPSGFAQMLLRQKKPLAVYVRRKIDSRSPGLLNELAKRADSPANQERLHNVLKQVVMDPRLVEAARAERRLDPDLQQIFDTHPTGDRLAGANWYLLSTLLPPINAARNRLPQSKPAIGKPPKTGERQTDRPVQHSNSRGDGAKPGVPPPKLEK